MSEAVAGGILFLVFLGIFAFAFLVLRMRGTVIYLWVPSMPCFPHLKSNRPMRTKISVDVVHTLGPVLRNIFDETLKTTKDKELLNSWKKIKENENNFTIWGLRFTKHWTVAGETGKTVFAFSLFSPEEMIHLYGRRKLIKAILLHPPLNVHHPIPKKEWIQKRVDEAIANGRKITPELRKQIKKSHRNAPKEPWISFILHPTMLSEVEEAELVERLVGFEDLFKISVNTQKESATKLAKFVVYENAVKNFDEMKRQLRIQIHNMDESNKTMARQKQDLTHTLNRYSLKMKVSSGGEPLPTVPEKNINQENGAIKEVKQKINDLDYVEAFLAVLAILGLGCTIFGATLTAATASAWPLLVSGVLLIIVGVGGYMWKKRNEPQTKKTSIQEKEFIEHVTI